MIKDRRKPLTGCINATKGSLILLKEFIGKCPNFSLSLFWLLSVCLRRQALPATQSKERLRERYGICGVARGEGIGAK
jgi:hypothetical protein